MSEQPKKRHNWQDAEIVFLERPKCPACNHSVEVVVRRRRGSNELRRKCVPGYEIARTEQNGDGSITQYVICKRCREPYKISIEIPTVGNDENEIGMIGLNDDDHQFNR